MVNILWLCETQQWMALCARIVIKHKLFAATECDQKLGCAIDVVRMIQQRCIRCAVWHIPVDVRPQGTHNYTPAA